MKKAKWMIQITVNSQKMLFVPRQLGYKFLQPIIIYTLYNKDFLLKNNSKIYIEQHQNKNFHERNYAA